MKMLTIVRRRNWLAMVGVLAMGAVLSGCPSPMEKEMADGPPKKVEPPPAVTARSSPVHKIRSPNERLEMAAHTRRILAMDMKIPKVQVNDPDILDMRTLSPHEIEITAKSPGATQVILWDENKKLYTVDVVVSEPGAESRPQPKAEKPAPRVKEAAKNEPRPEQVTQDLEQMAAKPRELGPPLVDKPENLRRLHPKQAVWLDLPSKQVVLQGEICGAGYPGVRLEFFATYANRGYEAVVAVNVTPRIVHAGLLAVGAKPGHPVRFQPRFELPTGTEVAIEVRWKDAKGKVQSCPAQHWVRDVGTHKEMVGNWVFAGSISETDSAGNIVSYQADSGELICLLSTPTAMLDLPIRNDRKMEDRQFEAFTEHLPPEGTPVTLLLKPVLAGKAAARRAKKPISDAQRVEAEKQAAAAAEAWLALADKEEFSQCWETAAGYLRSQIERRDFVEKVGEARKPLGKVVSRELKSKTYMTTLPLAPDGEYVILQYATSFEHRKSAVETVTPMLDKDKKWRVSGYYIR
jgi:hypothetical protein